MRFDRLIVANYRSFEEATVSFEPGVTVVRGVNGAGKSSLLEACFFALYGAAALRTAGANLEDVITTDADTCTVELWFAHAGEEFRVRRELRRASGRASQVTTTLEAPGGRVEGARAVDERIVSMFRMDADAFLSCAYVRQGEVNELIEASPAERQKVIDRLVRLGVLETYRERASDARLGVKHVADTVTGALDDVESQLDEKSETDLEAARERVSEQLGAITERITDLRDEHEKATERKAEATATIEEQATAREKVTDARESVADLEATIERTERARADLASDTEAIDERIDDAERSAREALERAATAGVEIAADAESGTVENAIDGVNEELDAVGSEIETTELRAKQARENATDLESSVDALGERADDREQQAEALREAVSETEAAAAETREEIAEIDERIERGKARFENAPIAFGEAGEARATLEAERETVGEELTRVTSELTATQRAIERAEDLREQGKCPTCGQEIDGSPHVRSLDDDRERAAELEAKRTDRREQRARLDERLETAGELVEVETTVSMLKKKREAKREVLEGRIESAEDKRAQAKTYREAAGDAREEREAKRAEREGITETITEHEASMETLRECREILDERRTHLEGAREAHETRSDLATERTRKRERREHLGELLGERESQLAERRERLDELEEVVDEERVEAAEVAKRETEERIEAVHEDLETAETRRDGLQTQLGRIGSELDSIERLRERRASLEERTEALTSLYEECADLERLYGDLRADLRQRNIAALEKLMNEVFDLAYRNDAYDRITLDGEYRATIHEKSGATLEPGKLSGGERVLFNLALRCAIYQLLVEGADGATPMAPLILDEPTAHLDAGHVERIDGVVSRMRQVGVEQTIVVSHTNELIDAADHRIVVEQRPATNRSTAHAETDLLV